MRRISTIPRTTLTLTNTPAPVSRRPFHIHTIYKQANAQLPPSEPKTAMLSSGKLIIVKPLARKPRNAPRNTQWNAELDKIVLDLRNNNRTWDAIAMATGRPATACSDRFYTALDPALQKWTPAMFTKLNQMVEEGIKWNQIAKELDTKIVACQFMWRTLGNGKYRIKGLMTPSQSLGWTPAEMNQFWSTWIQETEKIRTEASEPTEQMIEWEKFSQDVKTRTLAECQSDFRLLINNALRDAPGWVKLETVAFVQETIKVARSRKKKVLRVEISKVSETGDDFGEEGDKPDPSKESSIKASAWTEKDHTALFDAVERHGLFSCWAQIRDEVRPDLSEDEVKLEYYNLSGLSDDEETEEAKTPVEIVPLDRAKIYGEWSGLEAERLNMILMKYSKMPIWVRQAKIRGIVPTDDDYDVLFNGKRKKGDAPIKKKRGRRKKIKEASPVENDVSNYGKTSESISPEGNAISAIADKDSNTISASIKPSGPRWNFERTMRLRRLVGQQQLQERCGNEIDWDWIAEHIGPGFDANMCIAKWQSIPNQSVIKVEQPRFWDEDDIKLLEEGIKTCGKSWTRIQREYFPNRTIDSIRRKVSNLQIHHDRLVKESRATAIQLKEKYPHLDVEQTVKNTTEADRGCVLWKRLEQLFNEHSLSHQSVTEQDQQASPLLSTVE
ncbi:hypothetical protein FBU30_007898 [Linnemannia zychae]|nr:hypothetical protein FBU30_007898 [Linnemannia zychae]